MNKTQVQLPEDLYRDLKRLASAREWSLAEALQKAVEEFLKLQAGEPTVGKKWEIPSGKHCGPFLVPLDQWTELAHTD